MTLAQIFYILAIILLIVVIRDTLLKSELIRQKLQDRKLSLDKHKLKYEKTGRIKK